MHRAQVKAGERIRILVGLGMRARKLTVGSRETRSSLHRGEVHLVLLAVDGSPRDRERLERIAEFQGASVVAVATRDELGSWAGRGPVAVIGVLDARLADGIREAAKPPTGGGIGDHAKD